MIGFRLWQIAGWTMLHYLWAGAALGAVALFMRRTLRSTTANVRYGFALVSLMLLSIAPAAIAVVVTQNVAPAVPSEPASMEGSAVQPEAIHLEDIRPPMGAMDDPPMNATKPIATTDLNLSAEAPQTTNNERLVAALNLTVTCLPWLWFCGAPLSFALTTAGLLGAERLRRQSRPLEDARITEMCRQLAASLRISYRAGVAICDRIAVPILVGVFRPMILLPAVALAGWDPQQLEMVLLHELAHVRRHDNLVNLLQRIVESLLFFQPMVWIVSGWVRREREHCCDELVVARTRRPHAYAEILVNLSERFSQGTLRSSSLAHSRTVSSMAERPLVARIRRILKKEEQSMQVSRKTVGLVFVGLLALAATIGGYCSVPSYAEDSPAASEKSSSDATVEPKATASMEASASDRPLAAEAAAAALKLVKPVAGKNYVVVPFATDLQRVMRRSYATATFFVLVNGAPMINDDDTVLNVGAVDFKGLDDALQVLIEARLLKRVIVQGHMGRRSYKCQPGSASSVLLGLLRDVPPTTDRDATLCSQHDPKDWKSLADDLKTPPTEDATQRESGVGDDLVRVYPICTPLSRYFAADGADCVVRNIKPLGQLTPDEMQAFPARVKACLVKLGLKQPVKAFFVLDGGTSLSKSRRAFRQLHIGGYDGDNAWWATYGIRSCGEGTWNDVQWTAPHLLVKVSGEDGSEVKNPRIAAEFAAEIKELNDTVKFTKDEDGRWKSGNLPCDDEFTLTVEATGYESNSQKFTVSAEDVKKVEVKLKPAGSRSEAPRAKDASFQPAPPADSDLGRLLSLWEARRKAVSTASIKTRVFSQGRSDLNQLSPTEVAALVQQYGTAPNPTQGLESLLRGLKRKSPPGEPLWGTESLVTDGKRIVERSAYRFVKDERADVMESLPGDQYHPTEVYSAGGCRYYTRNLADFAIEFRPLNKTELRLTRRDSGAAMLTLATTDGRTIQIDVDEETGIIRRYATFVKDQLVGEVYQLGIVRCPGRIVFPQVVFSASYAEDELYDAVVLSPISIKVNEKLADNVFKVARHKGSAIFDLRHGPDARMVAISEDTPDIVDYLLKRDATKTPSADKAVKLPAAAETKKGESNPIADKRIMARVGSEVITAKEITPSVDRLIAEREAKMSPEEHESNRALLIKKTLQAAITSKLILLDARRHIPTEGMASIDKAMEKVFQDSELPKLLRREGVTTAGELDSRLKAQGSSITQEKAAFCEGELVKQWLHQQCRRDYEITYDQMVEYYEAHREKFLKANREALPFLDVQKDIRGYITDERNDLRLREYLNQLKSTTNIWTIYDEDGVQEGDSTKKPRVDNATNTVEKPAAAAKQADDDVDVRYAIAAAAVAKAEWQQAVEANKRVPGTVPQAEVRRRLLEWQKMELAVLKARRDTAESVNKQAEDDIDVRIATLSAAIAKIDYEQAIDANKKVPGTVPQTEVRRRLLNLEKTELGVLKAKKEMTAKAPTHNGQVTGKTTAGDSSANSYKPQGGESPLASQEGKTIADVKFVGNSTVSKERLLKCGQMRPGQQFSKQEADYEIDRLTACYRSLGFFRARIGFEVHMTSPMERQTKAPERADSVAVIFTVDEGPRYTVRQIKIVGNKTFSSGELLKEMKLKGGDYFDSDKLTADLKAIQKKHASANYIHGQVKLDPQFLDDGNRLDLVYNIEEGSAENVKLSGSAGIAYTGQVTDTLTGKPIAAATVTVLRRVSNRTAPFQTWRKLGETKHETDADGRYTFTVPPDQAAEGALYIEITAEHPHYTRYYGGYSFGMIRENEKFGQRPFFENLALMPAEKISGVVVTPDGKPAAGVMMKAFSMPSKEDHEHHSWADVTTDRQGHFQINVAKGGEAVFWIVPKDYVPSTHVAHTKRGDFGRFVLEKGSILKGLVVDADGKPLPNVWVNAEIRRGAVKKQIPMPVVDLLARSALSDQKGEFVMAPLPAGVYDVIVADRPRDGSTEDNTIHPVPAVFVNREITLDQHEATKSIEVRAIPHVVVEGQFVDASGKPTMGFAPMLSARTEGTGHESWFFTDTQIDEHGHFVAKAPKGLKATLNIHDNEHHALRSRVSKDTPLRNGHRVDLGVLDKDTAQITVVRYTAPILLVKAVDEGGKPIEGFQAKIKYMPGRFSDGEYIRDGKPAGDVGFECQNDGRWRTSQLLPDEEFTVTIEAQGYEPKAEKLKLPEGAVKELELRLTKKS